MIVAHTEGLLVDGEVIPDYPWLKRTMRIPGARFFSTSSYALLADAVEEACEDLGITIAYGNPGAGKTFALRIAILNRCRLPVTWFEPTYHPSLVALTEQLLVALGRRDLIGRPLRELLPPLIELLAIPRLIFLDEAQRLTVEAIDHLRYLSDLLHTNFALAARRGRALHGGPQQRAAAVASLSSEGRVHAARSR